jgi:DNA-binding NarL/FixJ family response regulator
MRVVIAEDTVLLREGLAGLLEDAGHNVVARVGNAEALVAFVAEHGPSQPARAGAAGAATNEPRQRRQQEALVAKRTVLV